MPHHLTFEQPGCVASALSSVHTYFDAHVPPPTYVEAWGERERGNRGRRREREKPPFFGWQRGSRWVRCGGNGGRGSERGEAAGRRRNRLPSNGGRVRGRQQRIRRRGGRRIDSRRSVDPPPSGRREATGKGVPILLCNEIPTFTPNVVPFVRGEKLNTRSKGFKKS